MLLQFNMLEARFLLDWEGGFSLRKEWPRDGGAPDRASTTHCAAADFLLALFAQGLALSVCAGSKIASKTNLSSEAMLLLLRLVVHASAALCAARVLDRFNFFKEGTCNYCARICPRMPCVLRLRPIQLSLKYAHGIIEPRAAK